MKVKELIEKLKKFNPEYEVETFADYDESGTEDDIGNRVMTRFEFDGEI